MSLDRAWEALEAAQVCLERNLLLSATSRAYYAMFWAAQAALARIGITRSEWSHPALQASFVNELIRRRKLYSAFLGPWFNRTLQLRVDADYRPKGVSHTQATQAVRWASLSPPFLKEIPMAKTTGISTDYRDRLDAAVTAFSLFICDLCPDARLEISFVRYENEDAHIWISLPSTFTEEEREELANRVAEKSLDILLAEGFLILAGIEEPELTAPLLKEAP